MGPAVVVGDDGVPVAVNVVASSTGPSCSAAGAMSGVWKAPPTSRARTRRTPASGAASVARATPIGGAGDHDLAGRVDVGQPAGVGCGGARRRACSSLAPRRAARRPGLASLAAWVASARATASRRPRHVDGTGGDERGDLAERVAGDRDDVSWEGRLERPRPAAKPRAPTAGLSRVRPAPRPVRRGGGARGRRRSPHRRRGPPSRPGGRPRAGRRRPVGCPGRGTRPQRSIRLHLGGDRQQAGRGGSQAQTPADHRRFHVLPGNFALFF